MTHNERVVVFNLYWRETRKDFIREYAKQHVVPRLKEYRETNFVKEVVNGFDMILTGMIEYGHLEHRRKGKPIDYFKEYRNENNVADDEVLEPMLSDEEYFAIYAFAGMMTNVNIGSTDHAYLFALSRFIKDNTGQMVIIDNIVDFFDTYNFTHAQERKFYTSFGRKPTGFSKLKHEVPLIHYLLEKQCGFFFILCQVKTFSLFTDGAHFEYESAIKLLNDLKEYEIMDERAGLWLHKYTTYINTQRDVDNIRNELVADLDNVIKSAKKPIPHMDYMKKFVKPLCDVMGMIHSVTCRLEYQKYISNIPCAIRGFKIIDMRRYTVYEDFEACVDYDPTYSLVEEDGMNNYDESPKWRDEYKDPLGNKRSAARMDMTNIIGKTRFKKYARPIMPVNKDEELFFYAHDNDYGNYTRDGKKELYVNIYGMLYGPKGHNGNVVVRVSGFRPYVIVAVPDNWIAEVNDTHKDKATADAALVSMVRDLHSILHEELRKKCYMDYRFRNERYLMHPLPEDNSKVIYDIKDMLGYSGDGKTKVFKIELINPKLVTIIRKMLWFPYGGRLPNGSDVKSWAHNYRHMMPPLGSTVIERSDRIWLADKEEECKQKGVEFNKSNYENHPERKLFNEIWYPGMFGDSYMFTVYECNVDFVVRFIVDRQLQNGWLGLKKGKWEYVTPREKLFYNPHEVFVNVNDVFRVEDAETTIPKDPKTKKLIRELTDQEKLHQKVFKTTQPFFIACMDNETLMKFPAFPTPRFCPTIQKGLNFYDMQMDTYHGFEFVLGKPKFKDKEEELNAKEPDIEMWTMKRKEEDGEEMTVFYFFNETDMQREMMLFFSEMQPNIVEGWNHAGFDCPWDVRRCQVLGIRECRSYAQLCKVRDMEWRSTQVKKRRVVELITPGIFMHDLMYYMMNFKNGWRSFSLNNAANIILKEAKVAFGYDQIEPSQFTPEGREMIRKYLGGDITLPRKLADKDKIYSNLANYVLIQSVPYPYIIIRGSQVKVYAGILNYKRKTRSEGAFPTQPRKGEKKKTYEGAVVLSPKSGFYKVPIATLDFASLYPSIQEWRNLCLTTLVTLYAKRVLGVTENMYWRQRIPDLTKVPITFTEDMLEPEWILKTVMEGLLPQFQRDLKAWRRQAKAVMEAAEDKIKELASQLEKRACPGIENAGSEQERDEMYAKWEVEMKEQLRYWQKERDNADAYQNSIKVYMNSIYGFLGAINSLLGLKAAAACITREGQIAVTEAKNFSETNCTLTLGFPGNLIVIYGDTDSIMFYLVDENGNPAEYTRIQMMCIGSYLAKRISTEIFSWGLTIVFEKIYVTMILMAKKHYLAVKLDDTCIYTVDMKGVQTKRADSFGFLDRIFNKCVIRVLKYHDVDFMLDYTARQFVLLASGKVSLIELAKGCSLRRDLSVAFTPEEGKKLSVTAGMVIAEKRKRRTGEDAYAGDRFKFVVVRRKKKSGKGKKRKVDGVAEKNEQTVRQASEELSYAIQNRLPYDRKHYIEKLFDNMAVTFKYCVPGGEEELRQRWLEQPEMKVLMKKVDSDSLLLKSGAIIDHNHCVICSCVISPNEDKPIEKNELGIYKTTDNKKTRQHITLHYEGIGSSFSEECEVEFTYRICAFCKTKPWVKAYIVKNYQSSIANVSRAWARCQKCPTKKLSTEAIQNCTEYECDNLAKRIDAMENMETNLEYLRALRW